MELDEEGHLLLVDEIGCGWPELKERNIQVKGEQSTQVISDLLNANYKGAFKRPHTPAKHPCVES